MATEFVPRSLRVLHLEDDDHDHLLIRELLQSEGFPCEFVVAKSRRDFESAVRQGVYDLIISDYTLPSFDGVSALAVAREVCPETPFIFFSGTIGEEVAVESLKRGAADYVLKQRPNRLAPAIRRALHNCAERVRHQRTEQALRQSQERFRIVASASNDVIWEWDLARKRIWLSENFQTVFGHSMADIGDDLERWQGLIHPEDTARVLSGLASTIAHGGKVWWSEHRVRRADGSYAHVFDRASVMYEAGGKPSRVVGVSIDVTERKLAEEKIREQAALLDKASDAIIVCELDRRILFWSQGAERIYGWTAAEAVGQNLLELLFHGNPPPVIRDAMKTLIERGEWIGELEEFTRNDRTVVIQGRATLIRDNHGRPKSMLLINTDITERRQLEEQFLRAQRLESLGVLVSGIAHDLNNALSPILMGVEMLQLQNKAPETDEIFRMVSASARRGAEMVRQILTFARGGDTRRTLVHMDQLVKEMGKIIADMFPKDIKCHVSSGLNNSPVSGIPTQLHQVLMNLCVNARDAMPKGGVLTLTTGNVHLTAEEAARLPGAMAGDYVRTGVTDTGTGIAPEQLDKIFQPFFTSKAEGKGTGLGLPTSRSIVENHGGFLTVVSVPGQGSEFSFYLPAAEVDAPTEVPVEPAALPAGSGQQVLVVDDEELILALARTTLENYGYGVLTAASGPEALAHLAANRGQINIVVTDVSMPFMNGYATIQALRKIDPDLPVILTSGLEEDKTSDTARRTRTQAFIQKPLTAEKLLTAVDQVLRASR